MKSLNCACFAKKNFLDLGGTPPRLSIEAKRLLMSCLSDAMDDSIAWKFPPRRGVERLREALAAHLGLPDRDGLVVTGGIRASIHMLVSKGDCLILERPGFSGVKLAASNTGALIREASWEEIFAEWSKLERSTIWLTDPARNPDGRCLTSQEREVIHRASTVHRVIINQSYFWCVPKRPSPRGCVVAGSLHKLGGAGTRVGWVYDETGAVVSNNGFWNAVPTPWQYAWALFIERGGLELLAMDTLRPAQARAEKFRRMIESANVVFSVHHTAGPNVLLRLPETVTEGEVISLCRNLSMLVGAGSAFGCQYPSLRLSFAGVRDSDVEACVGRMCAVSLMIERLM